MSAQADTNCHNIFNVVSATQTQLAKIGATCHAVPTCRDMLATFPAKAIALPPPPLPLNIAVSVVVAALVVTTRGLPVVARACRQRGASPAIAVVTCTRCQGVALRRK
jgi:hypothetical protein